jgi:hypothetical protein
MKTHTPMPAAKSGGGKEQSIVEKPAVADSAKLQAQVGERHNPKMAADPPRIRAVPTRHSLKFDGVVKG